MLKRFSIILFFVISVPGAFAQEKHAWTLEECIYYAEEHSLQIQKQNLNIEENEIAVDEGKWAFVPSLSISSNYTMSTGRVLDPTTYQFVETSYTGNSSSSLSSDITIFEGGRKSLALQKAKLSLKGVEVQKLSSQFELESNVISSFMDILCCKEQINIAKETYALVDSQLAHSKDMLDAGSITESDVLQLQSQLFSAKNDISSAKHSFDLARIGLCDLLEIDGYEDFEISYPDDITSNIRLIDIDGAIERHPGYQSSLIANGLAEADLKLAKSTLSPRLSLSAGYGSSFSDARKKAIQNEDGTLKYAAYPFFEQYVDNASAYASVGLSIPILSGLSARNGIKRAEIAAKEAEIATLDVKKQLRKEILQAQTDCTAAEEQYLQAVEEARYAEEALRQITEKYNYGTTDYLSWNTAMVELAKSKYLLAEKKYTYILKTEILKMY